MKVYTYNDKVLVNSANDKWLKAAESMPEEVTIGTQTWKTANLAIDDGQGGVTIYEQTYNGVTSTNYYYTWAAAQRIVAANYPGWHIPTSTEWNTLISTVGNNSSGIATLCSDDGSWGEAPATNTTGMSIKPGRYFDGTTQQHLATHFIYAEGDGKVFEYYSNAFHAASDGVPDYNAIRLIKDSN